MYFFKNDIKFYIKNFKNDIIIIITLKNVNIMSIINKFLSLFIPDRFISTHRWLLIELNKFSSQSKNYDDVIYRIWQESAQKWVEAVHKAKQQRTWTRYFFKDSLALWRERAFYSFQILDLRQGRAEPLQPTGTAAKKPENILVEAFELSPIKPSDKEKTTLNLIFEKFFKGATITPCPKNNEFLVKFDAPRKGHIPQVNKTGNPDTDGDTTFDDARLERAQQFRCKIDPQARKIEFIQEGATAPIVINSYINKPWKSNLQFTLKSIAFATSTSPIIFAIEGLTFHPEFTGSCLLARIKTREIEGRSPQDRFQNSFLPLTWE